MKETCQEQGGKAMENIVGWTENVFDLRALFAEIGVSMALLAEAKGLFLDLHIRPETPRYFLGDPGVLREILTTVVGYCLGAITRGGVAVRIRSIPLDLYGRRRLEIVIFDADSGLLPKTAFISLAAGLSGIQAGAWSTDLARVEMLVRQLAGAYSVHPFFGLRTRHLIQLELREAKSPARPVESFKKEDVSDDS